MEDARAPTLTLRQEEILARVVESHVATGTPVGSKTLVERERVAAAPSTVRYELAVLEEQGLLTHPHTSAGRVPTDLGYRYYVDRLLERLGPRRSGLQLDLSEATNEVDAALRATTDALAQVTHLLALVSAPPLETTVIRHVELLVLQPQLVMVVVITSTGGVTKRIFAFSEPVDSGLADWAREYLNERVAGLRLGARLLRVRFEEPDLSLREHGFLAEIAPAFTELVEAGEGSLYVGGAAGVLDEFRVEDLRGYRRLLEILEQRAKLLELLRANLASKQPFVRVGSEFGDPDLRSVSLVAAPYGLRHRNLGTVSLLGPTRMDYVKAIDAVRSAAHELSLFVEEVYED
ncbi:MAG: heat-inducible transcriptional repressor HrcA [Actinomycetota bacterium]|nr:heat-inducible transcriptional repressor HrcA [Actinomycetota bacterium]